MLAKKAQQETSQLDIDFSTNSWLLATLFIMTFTTIPVKIGADMFGALNNKLKHCAIAVALGTAVAILLFNFIGGFLALVLSFAAISIIYWQVLHIPLTWSPVFTLFVLLIQFAMVQGLGKLGILLSS